MSESERIALLEAVIENMNQELMLRGNGPLTPRFQEIIRNTKTEGE